jgi:hypothetical protein
MLKKLTLLSAGLLLAGVVTVKAQDNQEWFMRNIAGAAQIQVTYRSNNLTPLNQSLNRAGISSLSSNDTWISLSMHHEHKKLIWEDGLGLTPVSTQDQNNFKTHYNQYQIFGRLGYNLSQTPDFRLYPFVGLNLSAAVLNIEDKAREATTSDFSTELITQTASKTLYQPNFGIELGAGFDYLIKLKSKQIDCFTIQRNIPIGVRAGYYINTYASDWRVDGLGLANSPSPKQSAVFLSFNIGLGYEIQRH